MLIGKWLSLIVENKIVTRIMNVSYPEIIFEKISRLFKKKIKRKSFIETKSFIAEVIFFNDQI